MKNPAFPFYVKDWLCSRRVLAMSGDSIKAYVFLLCESWLSEPRATLPNNDADLAQIARISAEKWDVLKCEVLQHFQIGKCDEHKGLLYNEKLLEISRKYEGNQRVNNKNAIRTRNKREVNAKTLSSIAFADCISDCIPDKENTNTSPPLIESESKPIKPAKSYNELHPAYRLAMALWKSIEAEKTAQRKPDYNIWAAEFEKIHDIDGHCWHWIYYTLDKTRKDDFWKKNIRSPSKFRDQLKNGNLDEFIPDEDINIDDDETTIIKIKEKYGQNG